jgi:hypothetical protein
MKYKVGDKVIIRKDLVVDRSYGKYYLTDCSYEEYYFVINMKEEIEAKNYILTIHKINDRKDGYLMNDSEHEYIWTDEMIESLYEERNDNENWSKKHYDFDYELTEDDIKCGKVRLDPYFITRQWGLNSKDDTGILFHCIKTIARFGDKNSIEREMKALNAQIKRMAELYGVEL